MSYDILLFDLDDTLLDFGANEAASLNKLFEQQGYTFTEEIFSHYNTVNKRLWADYEKGTIVLDEVLNARFAATMLRLGQTVDGIAWENSYRELLGSGEQLPIEGAMEVVRRLSASHRLFVITNGITDTQIKRLKQSGLHDFFEDIFDSQSIGYQKPSPHFFDYVTSHIPEFSRNAALIIGDSLTTDIQGGLLSGIDTCWVNRDSRPGSDDIPSTYTIRSLTELFGICAK
ncbi:YjjG family noncanonical pyrimidine nucleotidase [Paenibacillus sacheonensis]|uniref:Noncanonical pyrimidine nucleotidase, YjjG family n=1 Tax=Paenibacillus sacheonensis TaxID=742054 RepID=A0A7X5BWG9_9BACL|nr:YjjG family noncanonical pyrimidine nucleotidase [Paenibacillus sacheonensis]MBM7564891.1 2-haloacid dehalogenase [Paenibacillus sacheonensis]NBC69438.1 noncanonical pyrimidine nucleotidase, YjjG family [Paenibacillus sacheonensis]